MSSMPQKPNNPGSYKKRAKAVRERLKEHPSPGERKKLLKRSGNYGQFELPAGGHRLGV